MPFRSLTASLSLCLCVASHTHPCVLSFFFLGETEVELHRAGASSLSAKCHFGSFTISVFCPHLILVLHDTPIMEKLRMNGNSVALLSTFSIFHFCSLVFSSVYILLRKTKKKSQLFPAHGDVFTFFYSSSTKYNKMYKIQRLVHNDVKRKAVNALIHKVWTNMSFFIAIFWSVMYFLSIIVYKE